MSATISATFLALSTERMKRTEADIDACLDRLSEEQILSHPAAHENSVANLLLHLTGNIRQWILYGIDRQPNTRLRDEEFAADVRVPVGEIRQGFHATLEAARSVIAALPEDRMLEMIDPQPGSGWEASSILGAIYHVVGHLQMHAGQIILLTKQFAGTDLDLTIPRRR